jgi:hypothetical protein
VWLKRATEANNNIVDRLSSLALLLLALYQVAAEGSPLGSVASVCAISG